MQCCEDYKLNLEPYYNPDDYFGIQTQPSYTEWTTANWNMAKLNLSLLLVIRWTNCLLKVISTTLIYVYAGKILAVSLPP